MTRPLNVLIVEDLQDDADLLAYELRTAGFEFKWKRVETEPDFLAELKKQPDIILSDYSMPRFSGLRAAELARESGQDIPFILISGTVGEEAAVEAMKHGATDYLLKDRMARLGNAVQRAFEQKRAHTQRREAEQQIYIQSRALEAAADGILITDTEGRILFANAAFCALTGYPLEEVLGRNPRFLKSGQHDDAFYRSLWDTIRSGRVWRGEMTNRRKDGTLYHEEMTLTPVRSGSREVTHFIAVKQDVTERKRAEESLKLFRMLVDRSNDGIEVVDPTTGRYLDMNEATCQRLGYRRDELLSMSVTDIECDPDILANWARIVEEIRRSGFKVLTGRQRRKDGSIFPVEVNVRHARLDREYLIAAVRDITERRRAEQVLRETEAKFRQIAENIREVFWITEPTKYQMLYISPAYETIWGRSCQSLYDSPQTWLDAIHFDDRDRVRQSALTKQNDGTYDEEYRITRPDGSVRWIHDRAFPVRNAAGEVYRVVGVAEDITERRKLQDQYRQAQKMEAIGQLAGGVAHDFNNILAVIQMQCDLMKVEADLPPALDEFVEGILAASQRAAALTRQLLLFSRKETMQPRHLDLNQSINNLAKMLRRILGEDIHVQFKFSPQPLFVHADPGMMDQVLMNLVVNSRDAMPQGGRLVVETSAVEYDELVTAQSLNARPGSFVCLSVSDTGCGIPAENLPRVFEPFFTTKQVGKGTGLGLATVFGIVQQHRGWINVYSEVNRGTTFRIYLPCLTETPTTEPAPLTAASAPRGHETILLVEDDAFVRASVHIALKQLGYQVLETANAADALEVWKRHCDEIRLVLTDLIMPGGMTGDELASRLLQDDPALKVIFASGYSAEIAGRHFPLEEGVNFLTKPFQLHKLARILRARLDR